MDDEELLSDLEFSSSEDEGSSMSQSDRPAVASGRPGHDASRRTYEIRHDQQDDEVSSDDDDETEETAPTSYVSGSTSAGAASPVAPNEASLPEESGESVTKRFERLEAMLSKACVYGEIIRDEIGIGNGKGEQRIPQPRMLKGGSLLPHQLEGYQWLLSLYKNGVNGILADDMGLGKTIQTVAFISELFMNRVFGTHLVVAPLSTIDNWRAEFNKWAPWLSVVVYHGDKQGRHSLRKWLKQRQRNRQDPAVVRSMQHDPAEVVAGLVGGVVIASYEMVMLDAGHLRTSLGVKWRCLVVDEAHRLKNFECKLIKTLRSFPVEARLLLTGTPLQNKLSELWSILNFVVPELFEKLQEFEEWFDVEDEDDENGGMDEPKSGGGGRSSGGGSKGGALILRNHARQLSMIAKMHRVLRPFMLRRTKAEITSLNLPPKFEVVIECPLTEKQRGLYNDIQAKRRHGHTQNVLMQLRKACIHPHLFDTHDPFHKAIVKNGGSTFFEDEATTAEYLKTLVADSSKLHLLDRMLPTLQKDGHKVLLFSQFTAALDIIEDYLNHHGTKYLRLDGSTDIETRKAHIAEFSKGGPDSPFIFLISTRAGGLGLNLVAADTVIIYDGDFNPYNDLQAIDRAHRIGQKRPVAVYRLVCPKTVEEALLRTALRKLKMEKLVIGGGRFSDLNRIGSAPDAAGAASKPSSPTAAGAALPDGTTPADVAEDWDVAALQEVHAAAMSLSVGDAKQSDISDEALLKLLDRSALALRVSGESSQQS